MHEVDPHVADEAPCTDHITSYDETHLVTYLRLLDAEAEGADWQEIARLVLYRDPDKEPDLTRKCWETHLRRAHWMAEHGYWDLLRDA